MSRYERIDKPPEVAPQPHRSLLEIANISADFYANPKIERTSPSARGRWLLRLRGVSTSGAAAPVVFAGFGIAFSFALWSLFAFLAGPSAPPPLSHPPQLRLIDDYGSSSPKPVRRAFAGS